VKASWIEGTGRPTGRPIVMGTRGMVSAGHPLAAQAGLNVLMEGGNVVDAAIASSAVLCVIRPHMTSIGGDLFCLIYLAKEGRVVAINASGPAPKNATIEFFRNRGMRYIPMDGPLAVETPGCVAGWQMALDHFGTMPLSHVLAQAVEFADRGAPVSLYLSKALAERAQQLNKYQQWVNTFLPEGRPYRQGEILKQPNLARTLRILQEGGADAYYRGPIAEAIADAMEQEGGLLSRDDLAGYEAELLDPIQVDYRGYTVYEQPPVSQGHILLQQLALAEGFDLASMGAQSAEAIHLMVECKKLAFADRLRYLGDPAHIKIPMDELLSKEYASQRRKKVDPDRAIVAAAPGIVASTGSDTTYHCVIDAEGNAVSMIQSIYNSFGSGFVAGDTGIVFNNRLSAFFLDPAHPNALAPGKRTAHTLNTYMVFRDGQPFLVGGTPGADDQVQVNFQIISNIIDFGMSLQEAIEAPRWSSTPGTVPSDITAPYELRLENGFPPEVLDALRKKGHTVKVDPTLTFGSVKGVLRDPETGVLCGGSDPRRDAYAVGW
jgi:gamma-glutamyltranspeptidase/glutathione hydrolase